MPEPVSAPRPLPVADQDLASVPAQPGARSAGSPGAPVQLPPGTTSIRVLSGKVEYVTADGKRLLRSATESAPVEVTLAEPDGAAGQRALAEDLVRAQRDIIDNISEALKASMDRIGSGYLLNLVMNLTVFGIGIVSFVLAALKGLDDPTRSDAIVSAVFGGLSAVTFLGYFISRPLTAVANAGPRMAWLLGTVNTYWTKLIYMNRNEQVLADLQQAQEEFETSMALYLTTLNQLDHDEAEDSTDPPDSAIPRTHDAPSAVEGTRQGARDEHD